MTYNMNKYQHMGWKALTMLFMMCLTFTGTTALTSCSSDEDPFFTVSENDDPRILNTDLADQTLDRLTKLNIEIKVTPIKYTTVTWLLDGVQIAEGTIIDQTLPMGVHVLKIVATTTVGKTTSRTLNITVTAAATDPAPAGSDIHETLVKQGTKATMHGSNISKVAKVIIGGTAVDATYNEEGDYIEYTVPELADGVYKLQLQDQEGNIFDAGEIELNTNPQYSGEKVIYTGPSEKLAWGAIKWENEEYTNLGIKPGMIITVYVTADAGAEGAIATGWWNDINSGIKWDAEGGCKQSLPQGQSVMTYTVTTTQYLEEQGFAVVGNGFVVEKITIEEPAETVIYEGPSDKLAWGAIKWENEEYTNLGIKVGTVITVYYVADGGAEGAIATSWWNDINSGVKWDAEGGCKQSLSEGEGTMEYEVTTLDYLNEQGLGVVGNGYVIQKVTIK